MPVLYGIRILILGIGVAAIAGTLLSALTPTNVSQADPAAASNQASGEATLVSAVRGQSRGVTVGSMPLKTRLTRLETELEQLSTLTPGLNQSTFVVDLDSGSYADVAGAEAVAAASTIKVPVLVAFLQAVDAGVVSLDQALVLQEHQIAGGSGNLQAEPVGSRYTALEVASRMIVNSDNTATNMMIDLLGGAEQLNQQFQSWGLAATVIRNPLPDLEGTNTTSARDLALLMALVDRGGLLSLRSHARMESIMQRTRNRSLLPAGIGQGAVIANKTGDIATSLGDVALVDTPNGHRYVIATLIQRPNNDGRASELIRRIAEHVNKEVDQPMAPTGVGAVKAISSPDVDSGSSTTPGSGPGTAPGTAPEASPTNPTGGYNGTYPESSPDQGSEPGSSFTSPSPYPSSPSNDDVDSQVPQG
jgi:beta-lactamase class A